MYRVKVACSNFLSASVLLGTEQIITNTRLNRRSFWSWLNSVFNRFDQSRVNEVGADIACAEWLLRCGAQVRWKGLDNWQNDYNTLPRHKSQNVIEEIDATDSSIMHIGFEHLRGLKHVKKIKLNKCYYLDDPSLPKLTYVQSSLEELQIISCGNLTYGGLISLVDLKTLKRLELFDLPAVKNLDECIKLLSKGMPNCQIKSAHTKI